MSKTEAVLWTLGVGLLKEAADSSNTMREHGEDMLANTIGASTVFLTYRIKF